MTNNGLPIVRAASDEKHMRDDDGDERIAAELLADIMRLAKKCEKLSGQGYATTVLRARHANLAELGVICDDLFDDLASYKAERKDRRKKMLDDASPLIAGTLSAVGIVAAIFAFPVLITLLLNLLKWLN